MNAWESDWKRIRDLIRDVEGACRGAIDGVRDSNKYYGDVLTMSRSAMAGVLDALRFFSEAHRDGLPPQAQLALDDVLKSRGMYIDCDSPGTVSAALAGLGLKLAAFEFHLVDREATWRGVVERAFLHLDRLIVADPGVANAWGRAYAAGETACERLGGAHLLHHGIWAFKAYGEGERTDLVLNEPLRVDDIELATRAGTVLVLTEWKKIATAADAPAAHALALRQAQQYGRGVLGGVELASARYIVTVAPMRVQPLAPITMGSTTYRHLHVATSPASPSRS